MHGRRLRWRRWNTVHNGESINQRRMEGRAFIVTVVSEGEW
jgi:hypothetical protein